MEEKLLNVLFDKKVEEFMEYQKHIYLIPKGVVDGRKNI